MFLPPIGYGKYCGQCKRDGTPDGFGTWVCTEPLIPKFNGKIIMGCWSDGKLFANTENIDYAAEIFTGSYSSTLTDKDKAKCGEYTIAVLKENAEIRN